MPLRVLREIRDLKIAVEVGFVVGTIPQMIPTGSAIVIVPRLSSSSRTPHVFSSLYLFTSLMEEVQIVAVMLAVFVLAKSRLGNLLIPSIFAIALVMCIGLGKA